MKFLVVVTPSYIYQKPYTKTKLKETKGYEKNHITKYGTKVLDLIRSFIHGVGYHLHGTWVIMKATKWLYMLSQIRIVINYNLLKYFYTYIRVIES